MPAHSSRRCGHRHKDNDLLNDQLAVAHDVEALDAQLHRRLQDPRVNLRGWYWQMRIHKQIDLR
jgi:hypothetical protein